ncbi:TMEM14 family protein [Planctomyces sp. SH-PL62]|uniref:TMEM14 family protein n=1 Tax=Planctomyces sp. SH-PL62 TaxID=1636152 RepID=UPI0008382171|nr:TMEM14 family protein [Planctomyces sp. SH-PL62]
MIHSAQILLAVYIAFLGAGGIVGYKKVGSRASLIAGNTSAVLCLAALLYSLLVDAERGLQAAAILALVLTIYFNYRFVAKTRRFMPSGLLAFISLGVFTWLLITVL